MEGSLEIQGSGVFYCQWKIRTIKFDKISRNIQCHDRKQRLKYSFQLGDDDAKIIVGPKSFMFQIKGKKIIKGKVESKKST